MVLSNLDNRPVNSMFVSTYQTIADHLAHNAGSVLSYASLEIVLIDATNGIAGYEMTLSLFSFPEISNPSWIIGKGSSFSGLPSASQLPLFPFKELTI